MIAANLEIFAAHVATTAVNGLWQGTLIAASLWLGMRWMRGLGAAQRFAVWAGGFLLAVALPILTPVMHEGQTSAVRAGEGWAWTLLAFWTVLFAVRAGRLLSQGFLLRQTWKAAVPVEPGGEINALLLSQPRHPKLCTSESVNAPSVIGFFRPRLLVPLGMLETLSADELQQIVVHECEHLRRYDDWLNLAQKLAMTVFPLNPALVFVDRRLGLERELACDAGVISATGKPLIYAASLTRLAEHRLGASRLMLALSAWERRSELGRRVMALIQPVTRTSAVRVRVASGVLGAALACGAFGLVHVPTVISFGGAAEMAAATAPALSAPMLPRPGHIQLVSAVMPGRRPAAKLVRASRSAKPKGRAMRYGAAERSGSRPFVEARAPQVAAQRYYVPVRFTPSYAAVPFGDGWLIVQL